MLSAAVSAGISLLLTWYLQGLPLICPAIHPAPASCAAEARFTPAAVGSAAVALVFVVVLLAANIRGPARRRAILRGSTAALGIVAVASPVWTLVSSGFSVDTAFLLPASGLASCAVLTVWMLRRGPA